MAQSPYLDQNAPEILALERQKKLADLLQARALEQPQGQMVSGRFVAPSLVQQLAPLANAYMGRKAGEDVESRQAKLANLMRGQNVTETKDILETMYGKQGVTGNLPLEGTNQAIGSLEEPMGDYVAPQAAVTPDKMGALLKSLNAQSTGGQSLAPTILAQLNAKPVFHSVAPGASLVQETPSGVKPVFTVPKENVVTGNLAEAADFLGFGKDPSKWTSNQRKEIDDYMERDANRRRMKINVGDPTGTVGGGLNNNGVPVGKFDKTGRYISPKGEVFPATAVTAARTEHDAATDLAFKLNQLSKKDIKNAYGSLTDYTTSRVGRMAGPEDTINAQTKINNLQIGALLDNLSRLKGASSDKEMAQMIKDFPGYEASPKIMENWVERASTATNRFLKRSENRFGFDTEYATENRFSAKEEPKTTDEKFTIRRKQQ
jgi:flagellar hook-associated protein FlgK